MQSVKHVEHKIIYKDPYAYCAHPHLVRLLTDEWVVVFNKAIRRSFILHPPNDPQYYNMIIRSPDRGETWSNPRVAPGYEWHGVECAGLTVLADGTLLLNQWRFRWYPLETARKLSCKESLFFPEEWVQEELRASAELDSGSLLPAEPAELMPWARANDGAYVHRSSDGGKTWDETVRIHTYPYAGGYGMRGGVQLSNGDILLALSDVPYYRTVFVVRSTDGGRSWGAPMAVAQQPDRAFEEPCALVLQNDQVIMLLRENTTHYLHQCVSTDGGRTWSAPVPTPILGYPAHLLHLPDGRIVCVYGYRYPPYGIHAVISQDQGQSWDTENFLIIRADLPNRDLGYPSSVLLEDNRICTVYYGQDIDGVTCIQSTSYQLED
jgi:hypothetical protein